MSELPLTNTLEVDSASDVATAIGDCRGSQTPLYPFGGATSLDYGLPAKQPGIGLSLAKLNRTIDYPARDMTITVEAGVTMASLAEMLAVESQQLPLDLPKSEKATIGGVVATAWSGPRRFGMGTVRDYVIGISAVDGRGRAFKGGGRVVKNVAGYDFCKLLTGSLGTLAVITQITLKLRPQSERTAMLACRPKSLAEADRLLNELTTTRTTPTTIELLAGQAWNDDPLLGGAKRAPCYLLLGFEGTAIEVGWQMAELTEEWKRLGVIEVQPIEGAAVSELMGRLTEFPALPGSPLVLKASVKPSGAARMIEALLKVDPRASIEAHAANGIVIARLADFPKNGLSRSLIGELQPAASSAGGHIVILSNPGAAEMTRQAVWGSATSAPLMTAVKREFDPVDILNRGRFVY
jgi:glycolate oxidase FAD binding subunit